MNNRIIMLFGAGRAIEFPSDYADAFEQQRATWLCLPQSNARDGMKSTAAKSKEESLCYADQIFSSRDLFDMNDQLFSMPRSILTSNRIERSSENSEEWISNQRSNQRQECSDGWLTNLDWQHIIEIRQHLSLNDSASTPIVTNYPVWTRIYLLLMANFLFALLRRLIRWKQSFLSATKRRRDKEKNVLVTWMHSIHTSSHPKTPINYWNTVSFTVYQSHLCSERHVFPGHTEHVHHSHPLDISLSIDQ